MSLEILVIAAVLVGLGVSIAAVIHPAGPALIVLLITPFDPILTNIFGLAGNYITILPIILVLFKTNPARWGYLFLGTRAQRALFFFVMIMSISVAIGYREVGSAAIATYLQRFAGFLLAGVIADGFKNNNYVDLCLKVLTISMALFALVSMLEFYVGIHLIPTGGSVADLGLSAAEETVNVHASRLPGAGRSVPINRFALQLLLPIGISIGWLMSGNRRFRGLAELSCLIVLLSALVGTMSRSGFLGLAVGAAVVTVSAFRLRPTMVLATLALAGILAFGADRVLTHLDLNQELASRLAGRDIDAGSTTRLSAWTHGLKLFADSPVFGVGYGVHTTPGVPWSPTARDPHNAYIRVLSFYGVVGAVFFFYFVWSLFRTLLRSALRAEDRLEYWRPYMLAGFWSLLVVNSFNSYFFDRFMFIVLGFAAALELSRRASAAAIIRGADGNQANHLSLHGDARREPGSDPNDAWANVPPTEGRSARTSDSVWHRV